ncbi:MAG: hypothetical protein M1819_001939 [Sarea resinae]|nr:MAG: hypothetical protein M1819_001939 [Sarea resinae]
MGGGEDSSREHLLIILPKMFEEYVAVVKKKHPLFKVTFYPQEKVPRDLPGAGHGDGIFPPDLFQDVTILVTLFALPPHPSECPKLQLIHFVSAGTNHVVKSPIYTDTDITLTTSSGIHGPQIAEWVLMTLLSHVHYQKGLLKWQSEHKWAQYEDMPAVADLVGQRFGVLGYGSIGRQAARAAKAMGMDVIAYTAGPRDTPESKKDKGFIVPGTGDADGTIPSAWYSGSDKESLHHFLKQDIDVLLVSVPLTPATRHLLGAAEFDLLGRTKNTFISNISRGQIVDQAALIRALKQPVAEGGLRGAALDVTDPEPLPRDSELWDLDNVQVTPHISGRGIAYSERSFQVLELNLQKRARGEKLINVVDRRRGY